MATVWENNDIMDSVISGKDKYITNLDVMKIISRQHEPLVQYCSKLRPLAYYIVLNKQETLGQECADSQE